jgi:hypothetical protein
MALTDGFFDELTEQILSDIAGNFFGIRKQLDDIIDLFQEYVQTLQKKASYVDSRTEFLNYLLISPEAARDFYGSMGLDSKIFMREGRISKGMLPPEIPSALTLKGEYVKLVIWAYEALQKACDEYMNGKAFETLTQPGASDEIDVHYKLVKSLCILINEEMDKINKRMPPCQVLQRVKRFDIETRSKEVFTGGGSFYGDDCTLNQAMAFQHLDFESFKIRIFPEPPKSDRLISRISDICGRIYAQDKEKVKTLVRDLKARCKSRDV